MSENNFIPFLIDNPLTVRKIASQLEMAPADVERDLAQLEESLEGTKWKMVVHPALCRKCGFRFGSDKLTKPARCSECKAKVMTEPEIEIRSRGRS
jgi:predicted Zn-ribbon and HTH transcriptional regulator